MTKTIAPTHYSTVSSQFIADWLKHHRRFQADFAALTPDDVPEDEQDMWIFAHAAT